MSQLNDCAMLPLVAGDFQIYDADANGKLHRDELINAKTLEDFVSRFILTESKDALARFLDDPNAMDVALQDVIRKRLGEIRDGNDGSLAGCLKPSDRERVKLWLKREFSNGWIRANVSFSPSYNYTHSPVTVQFYQDGSEPFEQLVDTQSHTVGLPPVLSLSANLLRGNFTFGGNISTAFKPEFISGTTNLTVSNPEGKILDQQNFQDENPSFGFDITPNATVGTRDGQFSLSVNGNVNRRSNPLPDELSNGGKIGAVFRLRPVKGGKFFLEASGNYNNDDYAATNVDNQQNKDGYGGSGHFEMGVQPSDKTGGYLAYTYNRSHGINSFDETKSNNHQINLEWQVSPVDGFQIKGGPNVNFSDTHSGYTDGRKIVAVSEKHAGGYITIAKDMDKKNKLHLEGALGFDVNTGTGTLSGTSLMGFQAFTASVRPNKAIMLTLDLFHAQTSGSLKIESGGDVNRDRDEYAMVLNGRITPNDAFETWARVKLALLEQDDFQLERHFQMAVLKWGASGRLLNHTSAQLWLGGSVAGTLIDDQNEFAPGSSGSKKEIIAGLNLELRGLKLAGEK